MANLEHLEILKQGVDTWNKWREEHINVRPDLSGVDLSEANFSGADLSFTDFSDTNLNDANLANAFFGGADLSYADLGGADLGGADLSRVDLSSTNLGDAYLNDAYLGGATFSRANLTDADFTNAGLAYTTFANNDLSEVKGLETVRHHAPSSISIDTLYKSAGKIPVVFLRGCGVPEDFITYMRSLTVQPIQFYKSFISYSSKNQEFANRLYADLQNKGVRCWLASEDLKIGAKIRTGIDEAIRLHDKLLLVLSKHSVISDWVEQEVETALERERRERRLILFPIRLDETVMNVEGGWPALIRNTRNIGDFRKWKQHDPYQKAFERLLRDLKAEEARP
ncbi:MAG TPA: toll/interleukin-1 receptor domain-containing protein [Pyrinomonadaceae bacterium]|nr:toll/interleukin-1 receptor domain-containing protein [Pyrinomonadaceae bacterium]